MEKVIPMCISEGAKLKEGERERERKEIRGQEMK